MLLLREIIARYEACLTRAYYYRFNMFHFYIGFDEPIKIIPMKKQRACFKVENSCFPV